MSTVSPDDERPDTPTGWRGKLDVRVQRIRSVLERRYQELLERTTWAEIATKAVGRHTAANGSMLAGYLAYRMFLLLVPLGLIVVALAGFDQTGSQEAGEKLRLGRAITQSIAQAGHDTERSRLPLLITGLVSFVIAAWGLLGALQYSSAVAWGIPTRKFPGKSRTFLRLVGSLLVFAGVIYISMAVRRAGLVAGMAGFTANAMGVAVGLLGLAWILPRRSKEWFWLLPGVAVSSAGYLALQVFATFYLPEKLANASETYGAMGIALTVLAYLFIVGALLWLMMLTNAVVWQERLADPPGLLRRIADKVPLPTTTFGSGYVPEDEVAETVGSALGAFPGSPEQSQPR